VKNKTGLTLIEVLIALVIISVAFTAILLSSSKNIRDTKYLEDKMGASWVATDVINQIQAGIINLPETSTINSTSDILNQSWFWKAGMQTTPVPNIRKIIISVALSEEGQPLLSWVSYVYKEPKK